MVTRTAVASPPPEDDGSYLDWLEASFAERPSRKHRKRNYRRKADHRIEVDSRRLATPDASRISKALLQAQRQLAQAQVEADARQQTNPTGEHRDGQP